MLQNFPLAAESRTLVPLTYIIKQNSCSAVAPPVTLQRELTFFFSLLYFFFLFIWLHPPPSSSAPYSSWISSLHTPKIASNIWDVNFIQYLARSAPIWKPPLQFQPNCTNPWNVLMQHWCRVRRGVGVRPKSSNRLQSCTPVQALSAGRRGSFLLTTGVGSAVMNWPRQVHMRKSSQDCRQSPRRSGALSFDFFFFALSRRWHQRRMKKGLEWAKGGVMWQEAATQGQVRRLS